MRIAERTSLLRPYGVAAWTSVCVGLVVGTAFGGDAVVPGEALREAPTVRCLGMRWLIQGDDNGNPEVRVCFRREGGRSWREGLPFVGILSVLVLRGVLNGRKAQARGRF